MTDAKTFDVNITKGQHFAHLKDVFVIGIDFATGFTDSLPSLFVGIEIQFILTSKYT